MRTEQAIRRLDETIPLDAEDRSLAQVENDGSHTAAPGLPPGAGRRGAESQTFLTASGSFTGDILGRVIGGRFEVQRRLVHDSFGLVLSALDRKTDRIVSLRLVESPQVAGRLSAGLSVVAQLVHPSLLSVSGVLRSGRPLTTMASPEEGSAIIVQGALEGRPVGQYAADRLTATPVSLEEACRIVSQVASALTAVHASGPHGAVSPETVWVDGKDGVLLTDLVLARALLDTSTPDHETREARRTLMLAPEVQRGLPPQKASDVYGLSSLLYVLLTGRAPGEAWTAASKLHPEANRAVDALLRRGLSATPGLRPATPEAFQLALLAAARADTGQIERPKKSEVRTSPLPSVAPVFSRRPSERPQPRGSMTPPPALFSMRDSGASLPLAAPRELPKQAPEVRVEEPPRAKSTPPTDARFAVAHVAPALPAMPPQRTHDTPTVALPDVQEPVAVETLVAEAQPVVVPVTPVAAAVTPEAPPLPQGMPASSLQAAEPSRAAEETLPMLVAATSDEADGSGVADRAIALGVKIAARVWQGLVAQFEVGSDLALVRGGLYLLLLASLVALFSMRSTVEQGAKLLRAQAELTRFVKSFRREDAELSIQRQVETLGLVPFVFDTAVKGKRGVTKASQTVWVRPLSTVRLESLAQIAAYSTPSGALTVHGLDRQALASSLSWRLGRSGRSGVPVLKGVELSWSQFSEDDVDLELEVAELRKQSFDARNSLREARRTMPRTRVVKRPVSKVGSKVFPGAGKPFGKAPALASGLSSKPSPWGSKPGPKTPPTTSKTQVRAPLFANQSSAKAPLMAIVSRQVAAQRAAKKEAGRVLGEKRKLSDDARARYEQAALRAEAPGLVVKTADISSVAAAHVIVSYGTEDLTFDVPVPVKEQVVPVAPLPDVSFAATRATGLWDALKDQTPASALADVTLRLPWQARPMSLFGVEFRGIRLLQALPCVLLALLGLVSLSMYRRKQIQSSGLERESRAALGQAP